MTDRFIVFSRAGEPVVRTNDPAEAARLRAILQGELVDVEAAA